jgi:AcrR family transcriptional regulator
MARQSHRDRLLAAALTCVQEKGYAHTSARDIASAGSVSLGSIGYHFGSKEGLLIEAIGEGFRRWTGLVVGRLQQIDDDNPFDRLERALDELMASLDDHRGLMVAFFEALGPATRSPDLRAQLAEQYEESRDAFAAAIEESLPLDGQTVRDIASVLIALFDGVVIQRLVDPSRAPTGSTVTSSFRAAIPVGETGRHR